MATKQRDYWWKHREECLRKQKQRYRERREEQLKRVKEYRVLHPEVHRKSSEGYRKKYPEKIHAHSLRRTCVADAATWTVYYWVEFWYSTSSLLTWLVLHWGESGGASTYEMKIANFTWTPAPVAALRRLLVGVGL